jgi:hypothetical protein
MNASLNQHNLNDLLKSRFNDLNIKTTHKGRVYKLNDFPFKGSELKIKLDNSGTIVLNLNSFEYFNRNGLVKYLEKQLIGHQNYTKKATYKQLYIYPKNRSNYNELISIIEEVQLLFLRTIQLLEGALEK